ncbi:hypothetical protein ILUMI_16295, partial [Ignelater luminosus]
HRRREVENAFRMLASRFRIFLTTINLPKDTVVLITQACCALHNFIIKDMATIGNEADKEVNGLVQNGMWRNNITGELQPARFNRGRACIANLRIRKEFKIYFNTHGAVPWQDAIV